MARKKPTVPQHIGKALAYMQDTIDVVFNWGFHKLKSTRLPEQKDDPQTYGKIKKAANGVFRFLGELGESFYEEYERIKKDRLS